MNQRSRRKRSRNFSFEFIPHKFFFSVVFVSLVWTCFLFIEVSSKLHLHPSRSNFHFYLKDYSPLRYFQRFLLSNDSNLKHNASSSSIDIIRLDNWLRSIKRSLPLHSNLSQKMSAVNSELKTPLMKKQIQQNSLDIFDALDHGFIPTKPGACFNTIQGKDFITDDRGFICKRRDLIISTGCCPSSSSTSTSSSSSASSSSMGRFSCHTCNLTSRCCSVYEQCVSCCQNPLRVSVEHVRTIPISRQLFSGHYSSVFEFCRGRCRHHSKSVVHENAYASEYHHCFDFPEKTTANSPPPLKDELEGVRMVVAPPGTSCISACSSRNRLQCDPSKLSFLNNCKVLEKYFRCRGSCIGSFGSDQASEVLDSAPDNAKPGACLFSEEKQFSCDGSNPFTRRLCPCV